MIYKSISVLIASLLLFPCIAHAESEPIHQKFKALTKMDAFMAGRLTGHLTTVCDFQELDRITPRDRDLLLNDFIEVYRNTSSNEAVSYALDGMKRVDPDCYKHIMGSNHDL